MSFSDQHDRTVRTPTRRGIRGGRALRTATPLLAAGVLALTLAACSSSGSDDAGTRSATAGTPAAPVSTSTTDAAAPTTTEATAAAPSTASATASAAPVSTGSGTATGLGCGKILTAQQIYDISPNTVSVGKVAATTSWTTLTKSYDGVVCAWENETTKERIVIGVAKIDTAATNYLTTQLDEQSTYVPTYLSPKDGNGYFVVVKKTGQADVLSGGYWITATSTTFTEPGEATPVMQDVLTNLGI
jgi:hypothetical protein